MRACFNFLGSFLLSATFFAAAFLATSTVAPRALAKPGDLLLTIPNPDGIHGARFGDSIAAVGDNLVIGATYTPGPNGEPFMGMAYHIDGTTGELLHRLAPPEPLERAKWGTTVTEVGGNIAVGSPGRGVVLYDPTTGDAIRTLLPSSDDLPNARGYGRRIVGLGDTLFASAANEYIDGLRGVGAVYGIDSVTGEQVLRIPNPDPGAGETFGTQLGLAAASGRIAVGSFLDDPDNSTSEWVGSVHVFDASTGDLLYRIDNPEPGNQSFDLSDWFGAALAIDDRIVVVGASEDDRPVDGAGIVHVFDVETGDQRFALTNPDPEIAVNGEFGRSVAIVGGNIFVGAYGNSQHGIDSAGMAYLFDGDTGDLLLRIANPDPAPIDLFGWFVTGLDSQLVVGAVVDGASGREGVVYVFQGVPEPASAVLFVAAFGVVLLFRKCSRGFRGREPPQLF